MIDSVSRRPNPPKKPSYPYLAEDKTELGICVLFMGTNHCIVLCHPPNHNAVGTIYGPNIRDLEGDYKPMAPGTTLTLTQKD